MAAAAVFLVRQGIIIAVQLGIYWLMEKLVTPNLNKAISSISGIFGIDEQDAKDFLANDIITTMESLGLTVALSKAKLPLTIAEKLGFTSKGFKLRKLSAAAEVKVAQNATAAAGIAKGIKTAADVAQVVAETRGVSFLSKANEVASLLIKIIGIPVGVGLVITNTIDFGAWSSSAYQGAFQKFLSIFGLEADKTYTNTKVLDQDKFNKVYSTYETLGAQVFLNPYTGQTQLYTKENFGGLLDQIAAQIYAEKGQVLVKDVYAAITALTIFNLEATPITQTQTTTTKAQTTTTQNIKVFTGVIAQGVLGDTATFEAREDDLITDIEELNTAMRNNLISFIAALTNRIVYEVKIVTSVQTKDGFTRVAQTQQIISGYAKNGKPKYKTVTNRWAILNVYILTSRNVRSKIDTIILGPTDAAKFQPTTTELTTVEQLVKSQVQTSDISEIEGIKTSTPITVSAPTQTPATSTTTDQFAKMIQDYENRAHDRRSDETLEQYAARRTAENETFRNTINKSKEILSTAPTQTPATQTPATQTPATQTPATQTPATQTPATQTPATQTPATIKVNIPYSNNLNRQNAQSIAEFFDVNKTIYPSVAERAKLYEDLGLGSASYYAGTAEQNAKLLTELKRRY